MQIMVILRNPEFIELFRIFRRIQTADSMAPPIFAGSAACTWMTHRMRVDPAATEARREGPLSGKAAGATQQHNAFRPCNFYSFSSLLSASQTPLA
jgi:hypothetical protein